jgi:DNA-binding PadR family transcriptional regulator
MTIKATVFRHLVLSLLAQQPMSGYDVRRFLQSLGALLGAPSYGAIYSSLHALLEDGLATVKVEHRPDRPLRKIYGITEAGTQELREWVARPTAASGKLRSFIVHLITVGDLSHAGLLSHLRQRRATVVAQRSALQQTLQEMGERSSRGQRLALKHGLATARAELAWLDSELARSPGEPGADQPLNGSREEEQRRARYRACSSASRDG